MIFKVLLFYPGYSKSAKIISKIILAHTLAQRNETVSFITRGG